MKPVGEASGARTFTNVCTDPAHGVPHVDIRRRGGYPERSYPLAGMFNLGMTGRNGLATEAYMFSRYGTDWAAWIQAAGRTATGRENMLFGIRHSWNLLGAYFAAAGVRGWSDYGEAGDDDGRDAK